MSQSHVERESGSRYEHVLTRIGEQIDGEFERLRAATREHNVLKCGEIQIIVYVRKTVLCQIVNKDLE